MSLRYNVAGFFVLASTLSVLFPVLLSLALALPVAVRAQPADWLSQAQGLERRGDWPGLLDWGLRWTQAEAEEPTAWFVLGRAYKALGRHPEAILAYRQTLRLAPGDVHARTNLGNVYRDARRYREALAAYREAVRIDPDYLPAWRGFGQTFYLSRGQAGVMAALGRVERADPQLARVWLGFMAEFQRGRDEAVAATALAHLRGLTPAQLDRLFGLILDQAG